MPRDAIHAATALDARLPLLNTFDHAPIKKSSVLGEPRLVIENPSVSQPRRCGVRLMTKSKKAGLQGKSFIDTARALGRDETGRCV